jgi:hypothetical protein
VREFDETVVILGMNRRQPTPAMILFWSVEKLEKIR